MKRAVILAFACITGCAAPPAPKQPPPLRPAFNALVIGKSTRADARVALGEARVVGFDSGYEVWVYRERLRDRQPPPPTELVLLFAPSGTLAKARIR